ncbi:Nucleotide-diphospho-sugar transferase family protein [Euphorbia peplus]|nr:Nucleotide-diphospho-sugar transferase family protein [Euphorbia peplus]
MKVSQLGLCSIWVYGLVLIVLSVYFIQILPFTNEIKKPPTIVSSPRITIFSAPGPFSGSSGKQQRFAINSWLASSPKVNVVLFTQDPLATSFVSSSHPRVLIDSNVDFTFLGTPFFHSMVERSRGYETDISVFVNSETVVLSGFISTLYHAYKLDNDWLLVASLRNVSYFPFHFDDSGRRWIREDEKSIKLEENWQWSDCDDRMLMAWNSRNSALYNGVIPPFLFGKGIHNHWIINEVVSSEFRSWENVGNAHLGASYGSLFFKEIDYSSLLKLVNCDGKYLFVDTKENTMYPFTDQKLGVWNRRILHSRRKKKNLACINSIKSKERMSNCSYRNQLKYLPPLVSPFSLESLLLANADENQTVVFAVAGHSYKDMLMSWVCRLRRLRVTNFLICALDQETYEFSVLQGLPVFYDPSAPSNISFNDCHFGTTCFQRVTKVKSRTVLKILKLGYNVLLSDVDVYWFSNPLSVVSSFGPAVLLAQSDEYKEGPVNLPRRLNSGFYFARSDVPTIAAMEKVVKHAANSSLSEQPSFYDTLCGAGGSNRVGDDRCVEPETNLTVQFLDRNLFPNGAYLELWQKKNVKEACARYSCLILHNNWISGRTKKLERQVSSGLWEYDNGKRMCCNDSTFVGLLDT